MAKQAVLLIHGIGEQRPMDTLRSFVKTVWETDLDVQRPHQNAGMIWSKPYPLGQNFELRRLTTAENRSGTRTDFFEFYWANLMQGTKIAHLVSWARSLLLRRPSTVPRHLQLAYWVLLALLTGGVLMAYQFAVAKENGVAGVPVWASLTASLLVVPFAMGILINIVGEAARYLHVAPSNVGSRQTIRAAGVHVLKSLHTQGYERIIVVGHSLGSVIGYDILYHSWAAYNQDQPAAQSPSYTALTELETLASTIMEGHDVPSEAIRIAQRAYFNEMRANKVRWRVSDFITLGSPLAHSEILLARQRQDLLEKMQARELACCPPILERSQHDNREILRFSYPPTADARIPHHAAVFGPTRWTNLYFPNRLLLVGDLVGGPLAPIFGRGIKDIPVHTALRAGLLSHTLYWTSKTSKEPHIRAIRSALDLLDIG